MALAGGSTPRGLYRLLTQSPFREQMPWDILRLFWGDERVVPPTHSDSNFKMVQDALLRHVPVPASRVFRMEGERPPSEAAKEYEGVLRQQFSLSPGEIPHFDVVLLGMGPDGHTASLFPGIPELLTSHRLVEAPWVEKFQTHRITLTPRVLNEAQHVIFLVGGVEKASTLQAVLEGPSQPSTYPVQSIDPHSGELLWLLDAQAASRLDPTTFQNVSCYTSRRIRR